MAEEGGSPYLSAVCTSLAKGQSRRGPNRRVCSCGETLGFVLNPSSKELSVGVVASGLGLNPRDIPLLEKGQGGKPHQSPRQEA